MEQLHNDGRVGLHHLRRPNGYEASGALDLLGVEVSTLERVHI